MKTPDELLRELTRDWPGAHPDDYDPTDEQLRALIAAVQRGTIEAAIKAVKDNTHDDFSWWFGDQIAKLLEPNT